MMMDHDDAQSRIRGASHLLGHSLQLALADCSGLMAPRTNRVESDSQNVLGLVNGLRSLPLALELFEGPGEATE
jgi:hypothetical protein